MSKENINNPTYEDLEKLQYTLGILTMRSKAREHIQPLLDLLEDDNALGLPHDLLNASKRALSALEHRPYVYLEDVDDLNKVIQAERDFAYNKKIVSESEQRIKKQKMIKKVTQIFSNSLIIGVFSIPLFLTGKVAYDSYQYSNNPEVIAQKAQEESLKEYQRQQAAIAEAERKYQEQKQKEDSMTIGRTWTEISTYNWRFRYLPPDPNVEYRPLRYDGMSKLFKKDEAITFDTKERLPGDTQHILTNFSIRAQTYTKVDGEIVPKFLIMTRSNYIEVLLRNSSNQEIDATVLQAYDFDLRRERFLKVEVDKFDNSASLVSLMEKITKP